jgi:hypothetical protein
MSKTKRQLPGLTPTAAAMRTECYDFLLKTNQSALLKFQSAIGKDSSFYCQEDVLQIAICCMLQACFPKLLFWHPKNEGKESYSGQRKKKVMGVKAGVIDLPIQKPDCLQILWLEVKVKPNKPTKEQHEFLDFQRRCGHMAEVAYNIDQAYTIIKNYVILNTEIK